MEDLGHRPLKQTLRGFMGVRSGLGRETLVLDLEALVGEGSLVAIAGANGRGKTTVMDNLHPLCWFRPVNVGRLSPCGWSFPD